MKLARIASLSLLLGSVAAVPARADVIVVDPHGGPGAALLQAALDAAHSGDVVLVKPGDYSSPVALVLPPGDMDIALIRDGRSPLRLPGLVAEGLDGQLLVRGLDFAPTHTDAEALEVKGIGELWVEDCVSVGRDGWWNGPANPHGPGNGLTVEGMSSVVAVRSSFVGGRGLDGLYGYSGNGGRGANVRPGTNVGQVTLALFDTSVKAGPSGAGMTYSHAGGAAGLELYKGGPCVLLGGSLVGGDEGDNNPPETQSGPGLDCILAHVYLRGATVEAGGVNGVGTVGPAIHNSSSYITELSAPPRFVAIDSPVREFESAGVHVMAQPGDVAWLFLSSQPGALWMPAKQGVFAGDAGSPLLGVFLGVADSTGAVELSWQLPALPPGDDSAVFFAQLAVDHAGQVLLGTASSVIWISASF
jgi:hypothetical protein